VSERWEPSFRILLGEVAVKFRHCCRQMAVLALVPLVGCASTQKVKVRTDPVGAEVYLQRRGDLEIDAEVLGVPGKVTARTFEEDFRLLGNAPVEYEFDRSEREVGIRTSEGHGTVVKHYREGTIRVERSGYEAVVRVVRFAGSTIDLMITLQPLTQD
jgi:hypothetical protein